MVKINKFVWFGLIILIIGGLVYGTQGVFNLYEFTESTDKSLYFPIKANIECRLQEAEISPSTSRDGSTFYDIYDGLDGEYKTGTDTSKMRDTIEMYCGVEPHDIYAKNCKMQIKTKSCSTLDDLKIWECNVDGTNCEKIFAPGFGSSENLDGSCDNRINAKTWSKEFEYEHHQMLKVEASELSIGVSGKLEQGDMVLRITSDKWGLVLQEDGYKEIFESCDLRNLADWHFFEDCSGSGCVDGAYPQGDLRFGSIVHYIVRLDEVSDTYSLDKLIDIYNGQEIYCQGKGVYYPIIETRNGIKLVDLENKKYDAGMECCTRNVQMCDSEFKITPTWEPGDEECAVNDDCGIGKTPHPTDSTKLVTYKCVSSSCEIDKVFTVECDSHSECMEEGFPYCGSDGICTSGGGSPNIFNPKPEEDPEWIPFAILGAAGLLGIVLAQQTKKGNVEVQK